MQINLHGGQINIARGNGTITVQDGKVVTSNRKKSYTAHKEGKDYIINGTDATIEKNIYVKGNIIASGTRHIVLSDKYNQALPDLVIEGNLLINGSNHDIKNIVQLDGGVVDNSYKSIIR